jgi:multisubunit Na+/H+ antiporter MnhB subunit
MGGGSAGPRRRKATGAALRYKHSRQRPPRTRTPRRPGDIVRGAAVVVAILVGFAALFAAFALGPFAWAGELWRRMAPDWPGGGYGFAATAGAVLPAALVAMMLALGRAGTHWKRHKVPAVLFAVAAVPCGAVSLMVVAIAMQSIRPKRSHRDGYCSTVGEYCWISMQYPYVWLVGLAGTVLSALLFMWLHQAYEKRRGGKGPSKPSAA